MKGLCFSCDDKWGLGHKCRTPKLFLIEADEFEGEPPDVEISQHSITGTSSANIMCVEGLIGRNKVVILIDSGSTHYFIDPAIVKKCGISPIMNKMLHIRVPKGAPINSEGLCNEVPLEIQKFSTSVDLYALPLGGCDMMLGVTWLKSLGLILWDLSALTMNFKYANQPFQLIGLHASAIQLYQQLSDNIPYGQREIFLQISSVEEITKQQAPEWIQPVVEEFSDVFEEPNQLPPFRSLNHQILLKDGVNPISVRPYRYPYYQKAKIMKDLLQTGFLRDNQSLHS